MSNRKWIGAGYYSRERAREVARELRFQGHIITIRKEYGSFHLLMKRED